MIPVPAHRIDQHIYEVADIQVGRHTQPSYHGYRSLVQGYFNDILPRPFGRVHERHHKGGDDFLRVEVVHDLIITEMSSATSLQASALYTAQSVYLWIPPMHWHVL